MDVNVEPQHDVPRWNETRWNGCWNPDEGVGLYIHAGRFRPDLDMWWVHLCAYLPDGQLCVDRFWGRNPASAGVHVGPLKLDMTDNGWTSTYDGVGELTTIAALAEAPRGSSAPVRSMQWDVTATGATTEWDMYADVEDRMLSAQDFHVQQGFETTGRLRVGDDEYHLDGVGFKDHSTGVRDFRPWTKHYFLLIVSPEWTAHLIRIADADGEYTEPTGIFYRRDGSSETISRFEFQDMTDAAGGPINSELQFEIGSGEQFEFTVELIHSLPITATEDNDYINGVDWTLPGDPLVIIEGKGRCTSADGGQPLYAWHERSIRRSELEPQGPQRPSHE
jgi:hypothetical protein